MAKSTKALHKLKNLLEKAIPEVRRVDFVVCPSQDGGAKRVKITLRLVQFGSIVVDPFLQSLITVDSELKPTAVDTVIKMMEEQKR